MAIIITEKELETIRHLIDFCYSEGSSGRATEKELEELDKSLSSAYPENIGEPEGDENATV